MKKLSILLIPVITQLHAANPMPAVPNQPIIVPAQNPAMIIPPIAPAPAVNPAIPPVVPAQAQVCNHPPALQVQCPAPCATVFCVRCHNNHCPTCGTPSLRPALNRHGNRRGQQRRPRRVVPQNPEQEPETAEMAIQTEPEEVQLPAHQPAPQETAPVFISAPEDESTGYDDDDYDIEEEQKPVRKKRRPMPKRKRPTVKRSATRPVAKKVVKKTVKPVRRTPIIKKANPALLLKTALQRKNLRQATALFNRYPALKRNKQLRSLLGKLGIVIKRNRTETLVFRGKRPLK